MIYNVTIGYLIGTGVKAHRESFIAQIEAPTAREALDQCRELAGFLYEVDHTVEFYEIYPIDG